MKTIKLLLILFFLVSSVSINALSPVKGNNGKHYGQLKNRTNGRHLGRDTVGAPLDGGLLTVLGVAGVAYYTARKKSKKLES